MKATARSGITLALVGAVSLPARACITLCNLGNSTRGIRHGAQRLDFRRELHVVAALVRRRLVSVAAGLHHRHRRDETVACFFPDSDTRRHDLAHADTEHTIELK